MKGAKCIGIGDMAWKCTNIIEDDNPHWCARCEEVRKKAITESMEKMLASFDE